MYTRPFNTKAIRFFDVTLRDGLQSIPRIYTLREKVDIATTIIAERRPHAIEVGSIVSPKILPQMKDSIKLYQEAIIINSLLTFPIDIYMLTPTVRSVETALSNDIKNLSFITSVSDSFQQKNINRSLIDTKAEISSMMKLTQSIPNKQIKLYISCISECPIAGKLNTMTIINEILYYYYVYKELDELCLSDTCGSLEFNTFKFIMDELVKRDVGIINKISLHLHNQPNNINNINSIITYALKLGIYRYDVSHMPNIGGCTVTMDSNSTNGNLSYNQIRECL